MYAYGSPRCSKKGWQTNCMYPMLCPRRDTVFIEPADQELSAFDVALYHIPGGNYVLHWVLKAQSGNYVLCGDNCVNLEYIPREWVIGKLVSFIRRTIIVKWQIWTY